MNNQGKKNWRSIASLVLSLVVIFTSFIATYIYIAPQVIKKISENSDLTSLITNNSARSPQLQNTDRGLRITKVRNGFQQLPSDITAEVSYKDVRLISTRSREFSDQEIKMLSLIIDTLPQKLFDYRPWAIVSTSFDAIPVKKTSGEQVAFASGPYIFVSDITFRRQKEYETGTFRGLQRVLAHELTHTIQFFQLESQPDDSGDAFLEGSKIVQEWTQATGWSKLNATWVLAPGERTTDYGKSNPIEDMADAMGGVITGDTNSISQSRVQFILNFLGIDKDIAFKGTVPIRSNIERRIAEDTDLMLIQRYKDKNALNQDVLIFQNTQPINQKDFAQFYTQEFIKRGWVGETKNNTSGEYKYKNIFKINFEIDRGNSFKVITMVMSVY